MTDRRWRLLGFIVALFLFVFGMWIQWLLMGAP
jgi:hypothetical protein